jgi:hypothetical protein
MGAQNRATPANWASLYRQKCFGRRGSMIDLQVLILETVVRSERAAPLCNKAAHPYAAMDIASTFIRLSSQSAAACACVAAVKMQRLSLREIEGWQA